MLGTKLYSSLTKTMTQTSDLQITIDTTIGIPPQHKMDIKLGSVLGKIGNL